MPGFHPRRHDSRLKYFRPMASIALPFTQSRVIFGNAAFGHDLRRESHQVAASVAARFNITPYKSAILPPSPNRLSGAQSEGVSLVSRLRNPIIALVTPSGEKPVESASSANTAGHGGEAVGVGARRVQQTRRPSAVAKGRFAATYIRRSAEEVVRSPTARRPSFSFPPTDGRRSSGSLPIDPATAPRRVFPVPLARQARSIATPDGRQVRPCCGSRTR